MQVGVVADARGVLGRDRPADVVVAAHVGQPARARGHGRHRLQRARHQRDAPRSERAPQQHHEHVVVGEVALLALVAAGAEVGDEVARGDDRLGLEGDRGRGDPQRRAEGLKQLVDLGLVLAVRADALPQERGGVQPQHVDADRGQPQHRLGHRHEDVGVRVVEVPLVAVERRPDPAVLDPREAARARCQGRRRAACARRRRARTVRERPIEAPAAQSTDARPRCGSAPGRRTAPSRTPGDRRPARADPRSSPAPARPLRSRRPRSRRRSAPAARAAAASGAGTSRPARAGRAASRARRPGRRRSGRRRSRSRPPARAGASPA